MTRKRKIYAASSWRNSRQPGIVELLRDSGHEVYDFRNPWKGKGFQWEPVDPGWRDWTPGQFVEKLNHPAAIE